tara:strand:- start:2607 stop:3404 length:798 start_codon:yes stop_codon:yes gene_type:complete
MSKGVVKEKIVVFDLDETLGNFIELGMFWNALEDFHGHKLPEAHFFEVMDMFPEFLRPNITEIMRFLLDKKRKGKCNHIMIYTNNQGPKSWARMIGNYFDKKLGEKTFDRIIAAFKVRGKVVEVCRTSHDKSVKDFFRCTKIPENAEICFLDDQYHPLMKHERVFYINVKPYVYSIPFKTMAERYYDNSIIEENKEEFVSTIEKCMNRYGYKTISKDELEQDVDMVISKKIMLHLEDFFNRGEIIRRTRRRNRTMKRNTRKKSLS